MRMQADGVSVCLCGLTVSSWSKVEFQVWEVALL